MSKSVPPYPYLPSQKVDPETEKKIHRKEFQEREGYPRVMAERVFGLPWCPFCGLKIRTKIARNYKDHHLAACRNNHWFKLSKDSKGFRVFSETNPPADLDNTYGGYIK